MDPSLMQIDPDHAVKQFKEYFGVYNKITEHCFGECVHNFSTRKITTEENNCAINCLQKYLKMTQRISQRFEEHHLQHTDDKPITKAFKGK